MDKSERRRIALQWFSLLAAFLALWLQRVVEEPLSLSLTVNGRFSKGDPWHLTVNPEGEALLVIESYPEQKSRRFPISKTQFEELKQTLVSERFFDLDSEYGEDVPDSSECILEVRQGRRVKQVTVKYLANWEREPNSKLKEAVRVLRVWEVATKWFRDPDAVDFSSYHQRLLNTPSEEHREQAQAQ